MRHERLPKQASHAKANGRRPVGQPRTKRTDYIEDLGWNRLGLRPSEMMEVMEDREVWRLNLELQPPQPSRKSGQWRKKKKKSLTWTWARIRKNQQEELQFDWSKSTELELTQISIKYTFLLSPFCLWLKLLASLHCYITARRICNY